MLSSHPSDKPFTWDNWTCVRMAEANVSSAVRERLRREIMRVDEVAYSETNKKLLEMGTFIDEPQAMISAPYKVAIYASLATGYLSIPLVFHYGTASMFNDVFVTADPPAVGEAETCLEVGSWAWAWMEPTTGALSFFLLCLQFARDQRQTIGGTSQSERLQEYQGERLISKYPQYDSRILQAYGAARAFEDDTDTIRVEQADVEKLSR